MMILILILIVIPVCHHVLCLNVPIRCAHAIVCSNQVSHNWSVNTKVNYVYMHSL